MGPQATSHALPAIKHTSALFLHQFVRDSKMSMTQRSGERKLLKPGHFSSSTQEWEMTPYALWQTFPLASVKTSTTAELSYINSLTSVSWSHIFFSLLATIPLKVYLWNVHVCWAEAAWQLPHVKWGISWTCEVWRDSAAFIPLRPLGNRPLSLGMKKRWEKTNQSQNFLGSGGAQR